MKELRSLRWTGLLLVFWALLGANSLVAGESLTTPKLHLKADTGVLKAGGAEAGDGENVDQWTDQSDTSYNVTQGTDGERPSKHLNVLNGLPVVRFDGVDEVLTSGTSVTQLVSNSQFTLISVFSATAINTNNADSYDNDALFGDDGGYWGMYLKSTPVLNAYHWDGADKSAATNITVSVPVIGEVRLGSGNLSARTNNGADTTVASGNTPAHIDGLNVGRCWAGNNHFFDGDLGEVLIFNVAITDLDRILYYNNLSSKWNVTLSSGDRYAHDSMGFDYDVWGLGQQGTDTLTVATSDRLTLHNPTALQTGDYFLIGHNNADVSSWTDGDAPSAQNAIRIAREWRVDVTNTPGSVTVSVDQANLPTLAAGQNVFMFVNISSTFAEASTVIVPMESQVGGLWQVLHYNFSDGDYVTFGTVVSGGSSSLAPKKKDSTVVNCLIADSGQVVVGECLLWVLIVACAGLGLLCRFRRHHS